MPNVVRFHKKGHKTPTEFIDINSELYEYMGMLNDPDEWCCGWYDWIAMFCAMGKSFAQIKQMAVKDKWWDDPESLATAHKILDWFAANYDIHAWYERK